MLQHLGLYHADGGGPFAKFPFHGQFVPMVAAIIGCVIAILAIGGIVVGFLLCKRCSPTPQAGSIRFDRLMQDAVCLRCS